MNNAQELEAVSHTLEEWGAMKRELIGNAFFSDRISIGLFLQIFSESSLCRSVLREIEALEIDRKSSTKSATQFRHKPLHPLWHKHFFMPENVIGNIASEWGFALGNSNKRLERM
jgi:hypothetical protein